MCESDHRQADAFSKVELIEVSPLALSSASSLLQSFDPEWDQELEALQNLLATLLQKEVRLRLSK